MLTTKDFKNIWKEIKDQIFNRWFLFLFLSLIIFIIFWYMFPTSAKILKIASLAAIIVFQILYIWKKSWRTSDEILFTKAFYVVQSIIYILIFFAYVATSVQDYIYAAIFLIAILLIIILSFVVKAIVYLLKSRNLIGLILTYIYASFTIILLFSFIFSLLNTDQNYLVFTQNQTKITNIYNYLYYSSEVYYSSNPGDIFPIGEKIKLGSQIEAMLSFIIHVILLNQILINMDENNKRRVKKGI